MKSVFTALVLSLLAGFVSAADFELKKGDHICIIGNTLAERMQYFGWLETRLVSRFPEHDLTFRNLGYSGDEITLRLRSMAFGTPDEWLAGSSPIPQPAKLNPGAPVRQNRFELTNTKADVIFAFFGYNESFAGEAGLPKFKQDLDEWIKHTLAQKYNGKSAPRLVLFSPIAHENLDDRNLTDGQANNARLKVYTAAMGDVAKANNVPFVDLFTPTLALYKSSAKPLTINGVHLNEDGDAAVANIIENALLPSLARSASEGNAVSKLRHAINDKNFYWFHRYRTTDGYSTYGDRAFLKFTGGQSNYEVVQRELEVLDLQTSNRDKAVWAVARGGEYKPVDDNLPPFIPVISNKPGPLPGGKHVFLKGEQEAISKMTIHKGMKVTLFAAEEQFPDLISPVQMAFDTKGRLWVATWPTYPHWKPTTPMNDKLLIFEDTDNDGRADNVKTFAGDLHNITGFEFWNGGVLVAQAPNLVFIKDTDGDDKYDVKQMVLHGLDTADTHHTSNSFALDPGGALYFQEGTFHHTQVETPWDRALRNVNAGVFRYEPRSQKFEAYVSFPFANPHGHVFDRWGQDIVVDGTGAQPYHGALFSGHVDYPNKHPKPPQVYQQRTRPCSGLESLSSRHFPDEMQGDLLVPNVIGFQGILRYKVSDAGASFTAVEQEPIVSSSDPNFRPADLEIGPDGALYFTDWHNPIIGHMQHNLRDPNRNKTYGRVYRVTYEGRPLLTPKKIAGEPIERLLDLLKEPEDRVRYRTRIELNGRPSSEVIPAAERWLAKLDKNDARYSHDLTEALWLHQSHNTVNTSLLERALNSSDFHARAAAVRVLCYWRDRVSNALDLLRKAASDEHPRVRMEAVRAASFFTVPEAVEIPLIAGEQSTDPYIDFVTNESMKTLDPYVKSAIAAGQRIAFATDAGQRYFVRNLSTESLLKENRTRPVLLEMLVRPGLTDDQRRQAVVELAKASGKSELAVVIDALKNLDAKEKNVNVSVVFDLVRQLTGRSAAELSSARAELENLATNSKQPVLRQIGFVSLMQVDGQADQAWALATKSAGSLEDFVSAMPLVSDAGLRAALYEKVLPLLDGLPMSLAATAGKGALGRFVRVELPSRGTISLAEVEVYSNGLNVARKGRASQRTTAHGGEAAKAIDGNTSGKFGDGSVTHTEENTGRPFWELDLGQALPIDEIVIYNRTDGDLGKRLDHYTLEVLDARRSSVFHRENLPAPAASAKFELAGGGPAANIRRAAMLALTQVRGKETETFNRLAAFVKNEGDRPAAIRALQRIPRTYWAKDAALPLLDPIVADVKKTPVNQRTSPAVLDAMEFADALVSLLPADEAKKRRAELQELGVRVIRLGTIFEKMSFDKDLIAVRAGKPVEFVLDNSDLMPHNFVIVQPGALEEVGLLAEANAQDPKFAVRQFVPQSDKVLAASRLMQPRDSQRLSFNVPSQPGVYPYVCTYPGHWRRMYGALYVVKDLDAYEANPEGYLAAHSLPIKDDLLKDRRPRTEWKLAELAADVEHLASGRSFATAKQMFTVASCVACHKLDGVGNQFGPDLAQLDAKLQPLDILKEMLDPSAKINEKFQTQVFQLESGQTITGLVIEETPSAIKIIENPLAKTTPIEIKPADVVARKKSPTSIMPKGLLDKLTKDEILDLVAFVHARGKKDHAVFGAAAGGHAGHHH
jgi:putative heme-binding domain-containing protein